MDKMEPDSILEGKSKIYYGWVVVTGVFFMVAITCGSFYSFGVFFVPIMEEFGWSRSVLSGVLFVSGITYAITVPFIGIMADRFGYKWVSIITATLMGLGYILGSRLESVWEMYLFLGLFQGIGSCAAVPLPLAMITNWFVKRQGLALGLTSAGIGLGAATVPLVITFTETLFGWRGAMFVLGILIILIYVPIAMLVIRRPDTDYVGTHEGKQSLDFDKTTPNSNQGISLLEALRTSQFWSLFTIFTFCILSLSLITTHLVPFARDTGVSPMGAASLLTTMGFCSIIGRLTAGFLSDRVGANRVLLIGLLLQGVMVFWLSKMNSQGMFYLFAAFFGLAYGGNLVLIPRLTARIFGAKSMGSIYGGLSVADGLGFAVGPILAGYLFDISGTYNTALLITAAGILIAITATAFLKSKP
jgi:MFS family permease